MALKRVEWMGSTKRDLGAFPDRPRRDVGYALYAAQQGGKSPDAKPLKGYTGASVLEVVEDYDGDNYRVVYTVRFPKAIYVLHAFQKKSKHGIETPKYVMDTVKRRLTEAALNYATRYEGG